MNEKLLGKILQFVLCKRSDLMIVMVHFDLCLTGISFHGVLGNVCGAFILKHEA